MANPSPFMDPNFIGILASQLSRNPLGVRARNGIVDLRQGNGVPFSNLMSPAGLLGLSSYTDLMGAMRSLYTLNGTPDDDLTEINGQNFPHPLYVDMTQGGQDNVRLNGALQGRVNARDNMADEVHLDPAQENLLVEGDPQDVVGFKDGLDNYDFNPVADGRGGFLQNAWDIRAKGARPGTGVRTLGSGNLAFGRKSTPGSSQLQYDGVYNDQALSRKAAESAWKEGSRGDADLKAAQDRPEIKDLYKDFKPDADFYKRYQAQYQAHFGEQAAKSQGYNRDQHVQQFNEWLKNDVASRRSRQQANSSDVPTPPPPGGSTGPTPVAPPTNNVQLGTSSVAPPTPTAQFP